VSRRGALALELRTVLPAGFSRSRRLGTAATLAALAALATIGLGAVVGILSLPELLAASRVRREMNVSLERRTQLGERLRALVEAYAALDRQTREHAARVDRIRRLYGLPEMSAPPESAPPPRAAATAIFGGAMLHGRRLDAGIDAALSRTDALLATLARWERERPAEVRAVPARLPVAGTDAVPVSGFGPRRNPVSGDAEFHAGLDLAAPAGATVRATADATVRWVGEAPTGAGEQWWRLGRIVVLAHGSTYLSVYGHCDQTLVRSGQRIGAGTPIATVGTSGWTPTPRLHYEIRRRGAEGEWSAVDPVSLALDPAFAPAAAAADSLLPVAGGPQPPPLPRAFGH
jgi:murein DD-endopeptidase MepM/ murein hydrolase activator NlpD